MKRCFTLALILALLAPAIFCPALSEPAEVFSGSVEAEVAPAQAAGDTGLVVEGAPELEPQPQQGGEGAPQAPGAQEEEAPVGFARVRGEATLYDADGTTPVAEIRAGSVALMLQAGSPARIALYTDRGIVTGCVDAADLSAMGSQETAAYLDAAASGGAPAALYLDRLELPLTLCECAFVDGSVEAPLPRAGEADLSAGEAEAASEQTPKAAGVSISASRLSIGVGETYTGLYAAVTPADSAAPKLTWRSGNKKIAKVDASTGAITGIRRGVCTVTVTADNGKRATCKVTVAKAPGKVALSQRALSLSVGMTAQLKATVPRRCASGRLTFKSSKPGCVSVDESGCLTALAKGAAVITVSTYNGKTARCKVTVCKAPAAVRFPLDAVCIGAGQKIRMYATAASSSGKAVPARITYAVDAGSPDPGCIRLNARSGSVTGVRPGQAVVTATAHNARTASYTVTVAAAPLSVRLNRTSLAIGLGEVYTGLAVSFKRPSGSKTCATTVSWSSSNSKVVKVDPVTGAITGVGRGVCTVTASAAGGLSAACKVRVARTPGSVALSERALSLSVGMTAQLKATVPSRCASGRLTFTSSRPKRVWVDGDGRITALGRGAAVITVSTYNGKTARCRVTVADAPDTLGFPVGAVSIGAGQKIRMYAAATAAGQAVPASVTYAVDANSPDPGCVKLNARSGSVTGVRPGQAVITATAHNACAASYTVTVTAAPQSVTLNRTSATIGLGEVYAGLAARVAGPSDSGSFAETVYWTSDNRQIAGVDAYTGAITGLSKGSCVITATAGGVSAECLVTVADGPSDLSVSPGVGSLKVGETGRFKVALIPEGSGSRLFYRCSDASVADVDEEGYVTALAPGKATVTVSTYNGKSKTVSLTVIENDGGGDDDGGDDGGKTSSDNAKRLEYVITVAKSQIGKPYIYGGGYTDDPDPRGFDCSGFVYWCFLHIGIRLQDSAYKQGYDESMKKITDKNDLRRGDLVFFNSNESDDDASDHSALYLGNGQFIHSASVNSKGIMISDMSVPGSYYDRAFSWGRRVLE